VQASHVLETRKSEADWSPLRDGRDSDAAGAEEGTSMLWMPRSFTPPANVSWDDLRVAFTWHRALLRGDVAALEELSAPEIVVEVLPTVPMAGTYRGIPAVLAHARAVVERFPLIDSSIVSVGADSPDALWFVTRPVALTEHGVELEGDAHLVQATIREGRVAAYCVSDVPAAMEGR
jgi:hypothetical protein